MNIPNKVSASVELAEQALLLRRVERALDENLRDFLQTDFPDASAAEGHIVFYGAGQTFYQYEAIQRGWYSGKNPTYIFRKMEEKGYIASVRNLHDERKLACSLTEKGEELAAAVQAFCEALSRKLNGSQLYSEAGLEILERRYFQSTSPIE
jgi:DNA-binding MarR family transcriptional regulator